MFTPKIYHDFNVFYLVQVIKFMLFSLKFSGRYVPNDKQSHDLQRIVKYLISNHNTETQCSLYYKVNHYTPIFCIIIKKMALYLNYTI